MLRITDEFVCGEQQHSTVDSMEVEEQDADEEKVSLVQSGNANYPTKLDSQMKAEII